MQLSVSDEGIRHCLVALSCAHESYVLHQRWSDPGSNATFGLQQYSKSINRIVGNTSNPPEIHVQIVSCILFVCIEVS